MAGGVCIGSRGAVQSVRLFSRVPVSEIGSLALDESSMTSNRLAQVILRERFGVAPATEYHPPSLEGMLRACDACVLIGDIGMMAPSEGLHVLDLGSEWRALTGLPFVWAGWIGSEGLTDELSHRLRVAASAPIDQALILKVVDRWGWPEDTVRDYLTQTMDYRMDDTMLRGLREFQARLIANGFDDCRHFPQIVS
jgi:chorismate dehydratase